MTIGQTLAIRLSDLPPTAQIALAADQRVEVVEGARVVALLVPVLPASMTAAEAWTRLERLLDEVDASSRGEAFRTIMSQEQKRS